MAESENILTYTAAGGVVVDKTGQHVLVLVRPERDEVRLPKGHIEAGESPMDTALREVREEGGYEDLEIIADLGEQLVTFLLAGKLVRRAERYYLMRARTLTQLKRPLADEAQFFAVWVDWEQAQEHLTFEPEREWVQRAKATWEQVQ